MESKGRIQSFTPHYGRNTTTVILELETTDIDTLAALEKQQKGDVKVTTVQWREPRSKDSNAYFHLLSDKLADEMRMSKPKMKNYLLFHYGQRVRDENGNLVIVKTNADEEQLISRTDIHLWLLKEADDGTPLYVLLEHSRFYDSKAMSILIDGVVSECKAVGIEVLPPAEIERLKAAWGVDEINTTRKKRMLGVRQDL